MGYMRLSSPKKYTKATKYLELLKAKTTHTSFLNKFGEIGVNALAAATPVNTGETAASWYYKIHYEDHRIVIAWYNSNENDGVNIAVILQYGHGTNNGGYVEGQDYINPAMLPVFKEIAEEAYKEVTSV